MQIWRRIGGEGVLQVNGAFASRFFLKNILFEY